MASVFSPRCFALLPWLFLFACSSASCTSREHSLDVSSEIRTSSLLKERTVVSFASVSSSSSSSSSSRTDAEALLKFKAQVTHDPTDILKEWSTTSDLGGNPTGNTCCAWSGVRCNTANRVVKLQLTNARLMGSLAVSALAALDRLEYLDLSRNAFSGNLSGLAGLDGKCGSLQSISLGDNLLSGTIPRELLLCGGLQELVLSSNNFTGELPTDLFSNCGSLQVLDLSQNRLIGAIPTGIGRCSSLQQLDLSSNLFSGGLPVDLLSSDNDKEPSLQTLDLHSNRLTGSISDAIFSNCGSLISISLSSNAFSGQIPSSLESCTALQTLNLSANQLGSYIPEFLGRLRSIKRFYLSNNHFIGPISNKLGGVCPTLQELDLSVNNLTGTIPPSFAGCSYLHTLNLANNNLSGDFPSQALSRLSSLENLFLAFNSFTGSYPLAMANCTGLKILDLSSNKITGTLPSGICPPGFGLEKLYLPNNELSGGVPAAFSNCSQLKVLDLSFNHLGGSIPPDLGSLVNLETLSLWFNGFTGQIPSQLGRLSKLKSLVLNHNYLSGSIPVALTNCSLEWIFLTSNQLTGGIPHEIGNMNMLTLLMLANNSLSGELPLELGNCSNLLWLDLNTNDFSGRIPPRLGRLAAGPPETRTLGGNVFAFVRNLGRSCKGIGIGTLIEFQGIRESALSETPLRQFCESTRLYRGDSLNDNPDFSSIQVIDLAYNRLEGSIPSEMGYAHALTMLDLANNQLTGTIPTTFGLLRNLGVLDVSNNHLEGSLWPLGNCSFLVQIDVSSNNFTGPIPGTGQLSTAPAAVYANNPKLCGEPLLPCGSSSTDNTSSKQDTSCTGSCVHNRLTIFSWGNSVILGILICIVCVSVLISWIMIKRVRGKKKDSALLSSLQSSSNGTSSSWNLSGEREPLSINVATFERPLRKLTFSQLIEATNGFSQESMIGAGGFGEVYKAELKDGSVVAIKKLIQFSFQGDREFMAEMETLGKIKHRNLVPLLGYCKVGEERLLVYEYMHGGSLDEVLHGRRGRETLSWDQRKQIAKGASRGLAFLHHNCIPHIIHRDMKSSNVLLDRNLEARVSDFGMARLINALDTHLSVSTLAGTPGYVPPEYYQSFRCTTKGDVYSFGVILLELLTGKRPTNKEEFEDSNLIGWVKKHVGEKRSLEVLDCELRGTGAEYEMLQYLRVACDCLEDQPSRRPTMLEVVAMFKELVLEAE